MNHNRRSFLKSGVAFTSMVAVTGLPDLGSLLPEGLLPPGRTVPDDAPVTIVEPFSVRNVGFQFTSQTHWIDHRFGWETVGDEDRTHLEEVLDVATHRFEIDGVEIPKSDRYRGDVEETNDERYGVEWAFPTRPRPTGSHEFSLTITFESPIRSKLTDGSVTVREGTYHHRGPYQIIDLESLPTMGEWK